MGGIFVLVQTYLFIYSDFELYKLDIDEEKHTLFSFLHFNFYSCYFVLVSIYSLFILFFYSSCDFSSKIIKKNLKLLFLQVHSKESEVTHNGLLMYHDFSSQNLPQIFLKKVPSKNFKTIW